MKLIESFMTRNPIYQAGETIKPDGLVLQTLWRPQPSAKVMVHNWNRETQTDICPHAFIDSNSGDVYQTLPFDMRGKHAGTLLNVHTIGIVICEPLGIKHSKGEVFLVGDEENVKESLYRTYQSAVELCASLCAKYKIDPTRHIGIYAKRNPEKLWAFMNVPPTRENFGGDVAIRMAELQVASDNEARHENSMQKIRIEVPNLRIRSGPGREHDPIGKFTGIGEFFIEEIQNGSGSTKGWGRLQSGEGWVSLDHVVML